MNSPRDSHSGTSLHFWNIDGLNVRSDLTLEGTIELMTSPGDDPIGGVAFTQDDLLAILKPSSGTIEIGREPHVPLRAALRWTAPSNIVNLVHDQARGRMYLLDAGRARVWEWPLISGYAADVIALENLSTFWPIDGVTLVSTARARLWASGGIHRIVISPGTSKILVVQPLWAGARQTQCVPSPVDDSTATFLEPPFAIAPDAQSQTFLLASPSTHALFSCDSLTGSTRLFSVPDQSGSHAVATTFNSPTDIITFHYRDYVDPGMLTPESISILNRQIELGVDRCTIVVDNGNDRLCKIVELPGYRAIVPLVGGGDIRVSTDSNTSLDLSAYRLSSPERIAMSLSGQLAITMHAPESILLLTPASAELAINSLDLESVPPRPM